MRTGQAEAAIAFPAGPIGGGGCVSVHRNLDAHACARDLAVVALAAPALAVYVVQIGVLRHLNDGAPIVHSEIASIASPVAAGCIQVSVRWHDYVHAAVVNTPKTARALPTASIATRPRMLRQLARCCGAGQLSSKREPQQQ